MKTRNHIHRPVGNLDREVEGYAIIVEEVETSLSLLVRAQVLSNLLDKVLLHQDFINVLLEQSERMYDTIQPATEPTKANTPGTLRSLFSVLVVAVEHELEALEATTTYCLQKVAEVKILI